MDRNLETNFGAKFKANCLLVWIQICSLLIASHLDEEGYLFYCLTILHINSVPRREEMKERIIIKCLCKIWTNFIKMGNPTPNTNKICQGSLEACDRGRIELSGQW